MTEKKNVSPWPQNCIWPEPIGNHNPSEEYDEEDLDLTDISDGEIAAMIDIKNYFDESVNEGKLNEEYHLISEEETDENWIPEKGEEYWDGEQFLIDAWRMDLSEYLNKIRISDASHFSETDPVTEIEKIIHYEFHNENLLRQAFTRRSFAVEHGLNGYENRDGCSEQLEFLGDTVMNTIVTKEIIQQYTSMNSDNTEAPFESRYDEGELTKIRSHFISKEYLSSRASALKLDPFILYGSHDEPNDSSREDMIEALIGAVTIDSNWNPRVLDNLVNTLLDIQLNEPDELLKQSYYETLNTWHQKHFSRIPDYEVTARIHQNRDTDYICVIRFEIPENNQNIHTGQILTVTESTRSRAREKAAQAAYDFIVSHGLWMNLREAEMIPDKEKSINQLQELWQKKYIDEPVYSFSKDHDRWKTIVTCNGISDFGYGEKKTEAKKSSAFRMLVRLLTSAGCCKEEWKKEAFSDLIKSQSVSISFNDKNE